MALPRGDVLLRCGAVSPRRAALPIAASACALAACGGGVQDLAPARAPVESPATASAAAAPRNLTGRWQIEIVVAGGQTTGTLTLYNEGQLLTGSVEDWSDGSRSRLAGWTREGRLRLDRLDDPPRAGFRSILEGTVVPDATTMEGTFRNDPTAPHGDAGTGAWTARRITR